MGRKEASSEHPCALAQEVIAIGNAFGKIIEKGAREHAAVYAMFGAVEWKFYRVLWSLLKNASVIISAASAAMLTNECL